MINRHLKWAFGEGVLRPKVYLHTILFTVQDESKQATSATPNGGLVKESTQMP